MESLFTEIRSDHIDENGVVHIDGWRSSDENAEGEVIAYVIKGEAYWRDPEFQFDPYVKEVVAEVIAEQQKEPDPLKERKYCMYVVDSNEEEYSYDEVKNSAIDYTGSDDFESLLRLLVSGINNEEYSDQNWYYITDENEGIILMS